MTGATMDDVRPGEVVAPLPDRSDARLVFIGRIRTPFKDRKDCPRRGSADGPLCRLEIDEPWRSALKGLTAGMRLQVLYWMHLARRDLVQQNPDFKGDLRGTFAIRSPVRPNPIASSLVDVIEVEEGGLTVRGLDCVDGTPLLDLKPEVCAHADHSAASAAKGHCAGSLTGSDFRHRR